MKNLTTRRAMIISLALVFAFLFVLNCFTPYQADDFAYHFRFDNSAPLTGIADIVPSMAAHAEILNGRLAAHSLVQLFELLPKPVFNFVNAGMFTLLIWLMACLSGFGARPRPAVYLVTFCAVFVLMPAFGEVCLWLDGSINYLWAVVLNLLFLFPYFRLFWEGDVLHGAAAKLAFIVFAFICGAFQETMSSASFMLAVVFMLLTRFYEKRRTGWAYIAGAISSFAGLLFMATRPAETGVKSSAGSLVNFFGSFVNMMEYFRFFALLIAVFIIAFVLCLAKRAETKKLILAGVFFLGFLAANGVMVLARIYPERCASPAAVFLIIADVMLLFELARGGSCVLALRCMAALLCAVTIYCGVLGSADIVSTFAQFKANEAAIIAARDAGEAEVLLPGLYGATKYSVAHDMEFPSSINWVNGYLARYYGVQHIIGYDYYTQFFAK